MGSTTVLRLLRSNADAQNVSTQQRGRPTPRVSLSSKQRDEVEACGRDTIRRPSSRMCSRGSRPSSSSRVSSRSFCRSSLQSRRATLALALVAERRLWPTLLVAGAVLTALAVWLSRSIKSTANAPPRPDRAVVTIPYLGSIPDEDPREGLIFIDRARAQAGLTVMTSTSRNRTVLVDLDGKVIHSWTINKGAYGAVDQGGNLFAEQGSFGLAKIGWDSAVVWTYDNNVHHDVFLPGDGTVVSLERHRRPLLGPFGVLPILSDWIVVLEPDGSIRRRIALLPALQSLIPKSRLDAIGADMQRLETSGTPITKEVANPDTAYDVFHTNSVVLIDHPIEGVADEGDFLVSVRELHLVAVLRPEPDHPPDEFGTTVSRVVWRYEGSLRFQHHASLLENDHILVFDNNRGNKSSVVREIDPRTQDVVWEYSGDASHPFYSGWRGSAQRLPNGNTLITESDHGRVFEVTPDKKIVWEYLMHRKNAEHREPVYRAIRITGEHAQALHAKLRN